MTDETTTDEQPESISEELIPKKPSRLCPRGIQTFTVARQADETGVSGKILIQTLPALLKCLVIALLAASICLAVILAGLVALRPKAPKLS